MKSIRSSPVTTDGALFVGRDLELETLRARLLRARDGFGAVVALVGEAGIGKTTAANAFAAYARGEKARVACGACVDGESGVPLRPWAEALGAVVEQLGVRKAQRVVGAGRGALARIIPALGAPPRAEPLEAKDERLRMHHAVTSLLDRASVKTPVVLFIDDLHWADADSLALLDHVARRAARAPWVILLAYREEEGASGGERRTPLGELLAGLRRDGLFERIALRGFALGEVAEYLARRTGRDIPEGAVHLVFEDTVGNPLYVREMVDHFAEEGRLVRGGLDEQSMRVRGMPRGARDVVARRLGRLRETTVRVLRVLACAPEPVDLALLVAASELPETTVLDCVGEARSAGFVRLVGGGRYEPSHAVVRRAIQDGMDAARRAHIHRRLAEALEGVNDDPGRAARMAAHYRASAELGGAELGVTPAIEASHDATDACAFERAVVFLRMARELAAGAPVYLRAEALGELVLAEARAGRADDAASTLEDALVALEAMGAPRADVAGWLAEVARVLKAGGAPSPLWEPIVERALAMNGDARDLTWARLTLLGDRVEALASGAVHAVRVLPRDARAVAIARGEGDEDDHASTLPHEQRTRAETDALVRLAREWGRPTASLRASSEAIRDLIYRHRDVHAARAAVGEMREVAARSGSIAAEAEALVELACCEAMLGAIDHARESSARAAALAPSSGAAHRLEAIAVDATIGYFAGCDWRALAAAAARLSADPAWRRSPSAHISGGLAALAYAQAGYARESRSLLAHMAPVFERCDANVANYAVALDAAATAVWHLGARDLAERYHALESAAVADAGTAPFASRELALARLAALLERWDEAIERIARAEGPLAEGGLKPLHAIALHDEASALLRAGRPGDRVRAAERLEAARVTFRALGMDPWIAHAHQLLGLERPSYPDGLTSREVDLVRLLAEGRTNKEIAAELEVAIALVQRQVEAVLAKIGAAARSDAKAYAQKHRIGASA
jgi:DNA-binding NarL/FixJ family response regulator